jgi:hypothetical protein
MSAMTPGTRVTVDGRPGRVVRVERKTYVEPRWNRTPAMIVVDYDDGERRMVTAARVKIVD